MQYTLPGPVVIFATATAVLLMAMHVLFGRWVRKIYDAHFFNEKYFNVQLEVMIPLFGVRRAFAYFSALGFRLYAQWRFHGTDLQRMAPRPLVWLSRLYVALLLSAMGVIGFAVYSAFTSAR